nr:hypothetical protein [Tanacetum cinerariifolium]
VRGVTVVSELLLVFLTLALVLGGAAHDAITKYSLILSHKEVDDDLCEPGIVHLITLLGIFVLNLIYKAFPQKPVLFPLRHLLMTAANDLHG